MMSLRCWLQGIDGKYLHLSAEEDGSPVFKLPADFKGELLINVLKHHDDVSTPTHLCVLARRRVYHIRALASAAAVRALRGGGSVCGGALSIRVRPGQSFILRSYPSAT